MVMKTLTALCVLMAAALFAAVPARADTTADCGRFYLKVDKDSGYATCVGGRRSTAGNSQEIQSLARDLGAKVRRLRKVLDSAEALLRTREVNEAAERRIQKLLSDAQQRTRDVKQASLALQQAQRSRQQELETQQRQISDAQFQTARELEQKQAALTQELMSDVRARTQSLQR